MAKKNENVENTALVDFQTADKTENNQADDKIVDVKVLPKRPMTTANPPNQRPGINSDNNVTYSINASNIEAELMIKEDMGDDDEMDQ